MTVGVFLRIDSGVIWIGDLNKTDQGSSRNEGVSGLDVVCRKLKYYNFTNFPGHVYQWRLNML